MIKRSLDCNKRCPICLVGQSSCLAGGHVSPILGYAGAVPNRQDRRCRRRNSTRWRVIIQERPFMRARRRRRLTGPSGQTFPWIIMAGITLLSGCDRGSSSPTSGAPASGAAPKVGPVGGVGSPAHRKERGGSCGRVQDGLEHRRRSNVGHPEHGRPQQTDHVESVPICRDRPGSRHRFRALFRHDRGEALPHRQRLGSGRVRL